MVDRLAHRRPGTQSPWDISQTTASNVRFAFLQTCGESREEDDFTEHSPCVSYVFPTFCRGHSVLSAHPT